MKTWIAQEQYAAKNGPLSADPCECHKCGKTDETGSGWLVNSRFLDGYAPGSLQLCPDCAGTSAAAAALGRKGGAVKTAKKANAVRENGKKGGRPNLKIRAAAKLHIEDVHSMGAVPCGADAYEWPAESLPKVRGLSIEEIRERLAAEIERQSGL